MYDIKGRPKTAKRNEGHGVDVYYYNLNSTRPRPASAKIGTADRMGKHKSNTPIPCEYQE